ncbi:hypothetical protein G9444_1213 [Rhodococcus erythropolis]|uniref:Uncharacterized protein n=1 Tax=Rhodococcus erythropolis TaxID=1833 RepID=A0A6G9CNI9_RHOER|nr:hypothetical protein G9444_1213 [Rhodococcus erythropolis]
MVFSMPEPISAGRAPRPSESDHNREKCLTPIKFRFARFPSFPIIRDRGHSFGYRTGTIA